MKNYHHLNLTNMWIMLRWVEAWKANGKDARKQVRNVCLWKLSMDLTGVEVSSVVWNKRCHPVSYGLRVCTLSWIGYIFQGQVFIVSFEKSLWNLKPVGVVF
ncbi:uncharacterized protein LOC110905782 [Helianthus annuus]|uniref:uncharacterized protein LOC110905782 n=1 Tax=Helianthus annuus TaxID=4232 RepID=UPI000B8F699E|nr:uncharacterized protein LOC110905782 [Helianthus annuus]